MAQRLSAGPRAPHLIGGDTALATITTRPVIAKQTVCWPKAQLLPPVSVAMLSRNRAGLTGEVVFRDDLIELIQYSPTTALVSPQPVLVVPSWLRSYDAQEGSLGPALIGRLVAQGTTVFAIVWRNLDAQMHGATLEDDRAAGVTASIDIVGLICGDANIHAVGYGYGRTLLSLVVSVMARDADNRLASVSLFALRTGFGADAPALLITRAALDPPRRNSRTAVALSDTLSPPTWEQEVAPRDASWWPQWAAWLASHSGPAVEPPPMDFALADAPDVTVLEA
jgi:poly(3-hydroxyalkanoate) synthetase